MLRFSEENFSIFAERAGTFSKERQNRTIFPGVMHKKEGLSAFSGHSFLLSRQVVQFLPQLRNLDILCGDLLIQLDIAFLLLFIEGLIASSAGLFLDGFPILSLPFCRNNFPGFRIGLANQRALAAHLLLLRVPYPSLDKFVHNPQ